MTYPGERRPSCGRADSMMTMTAALGAIEIADFEIATTFDVAGAQVVDYLSDIAPMGLWAVTRVVDGREIMLVARDVAYGLRAGAEIAFADSPCRAMVAGEAPQVAPDAATVASYADCALAAMMPLGAYIGTPILTVDGHLFGTLCGFNPTPVVEEPEVLQPLLLLLSSLLSAVLTADQTATAMARQLEAVQLEADTDALTGLLNRRGWDRYIGHEEDRFRRFGDQASVIVMDLDHLKIVNDTQGHDAGDNYIRRSAGALRAGLRSQDLLARLGGDEFGVIVSGADEVLVEELVGRMQRALDAADVLGSFGSAPITVVAGFPDAWKAADSAMYVEKRRRKSQRAGATAAVESPRPLDG